MKKVLLRKAFILPLMLLFTHTAGCGVAEFGGSVPLQAAENPPTRTLHPRTPDATSTTIPDPTQVAPSQTPSPSPTGTEIVFAIGEEITIEYLRGLEITGSDITFERELPYGYNFERHLVSYISEGNKIYGLLTIPFADPPEGGYKAIVFNHGYIPPAQYRTTERYNAYVDYLAASGFVVFKIDYRGHGKSEGEPTGSYFSPGYTIDSIAALKSLQTLDIVDPQGIGMWGHSMAGNLTLRAMLIEPEVKAGVIWAGAVYSYDDFSEYGIEDTSYRPPATPEGSDRPRQSRLIRETYGRPDTSVDFWRAVSLTEHIEFLKSPLQIHHSEDDPVVTINYSYGLVEALQQNGKEYEFYTYEGGGHNLVSPYFDQAMVRTVEFFRDKL
jgi:dipeptidyl aminopeptidase/acylaminoacyl peptidase